MTRSLKKGVYVHDSLKAKIDKLNANNGLKFHNPKREFFCLWQQFFVVPLQYIYKNRQWQTRITNNTGLTGKR